MAGEEAFDAIKAAERAVMDAQIAVVRATDDLVRARRDARDAFDN